MASEIQSAARTALVLNALTGAVLDRQKESRSEAFGVLSEAGSRTVDVRDDDGADLGMVSLTRGRTSAAVTDEAAFTAWVQQRYPGRVRTRPVVDESFAERILHTAKALGTAVDTETGEVIPGIEVTTGEPGITVRPNAEARARMRSLLADAGLLALPSSEDGE